VPGACAWRDRPCAPRRAPSQRPAPQLSAFVLSCE
jgi:hypothetical protein